MSKSSNTLWKWLLLVLLTVWSVWLSYPLSEKLPKGIDISGGYRFLMEVQYDQMQLEEGQTEPSEQDKQRAREQALIVLRNRIDGTGTKEPNLYLEKSSGRIVFEIPGVGEEVRKQLRRELERPAYLEFRLVHEDNETHIRELYATGEAPKGFQLVNIDGRSFYQSVKDDSVTEEETSSFSSTAVAERIANFERISPLYELMFSKERVEGYSNLYRPYYVKIRPEMDGQHVSGAMPGQDEFGRPIVRVSLAGQGASDFYRVTKEYSRRGDKNPSPNGRQLGIVMDNTLFSAPELIGPIPGGSAEISGSFTWEEAGSLAAALRSGALPAPVSIVSTQKIEPTLGAHSVNQGVTAAVIGAGAVVIFMLIYYMIAGVVVNLALLLDVLLLPLGMFVAAGFLGIFSSGGGAGAANINSLPTLTLPGIAGLVLTIGMAVDANVLIFERIREEQKSGKRFASAIKSGYEKVFSTIFDANVTTLLVAVILYMQGSGPIRGFAVMLTAGILVSMYTALIVTRMFFDFLAKRTTVTKVKMLQIVPDGLNIDFLSKRFIALAISAMILIGTVTSLGIKGSDALGVDFTGGSAITFTYDQSKEAPGEEAIRKVLEDAGIGEAFIQKQSVVAGGQNLSSETTLLVKVGFEEAEAALNAIVGAFGESNDFKAAETQEISGSVGKDLRTKGLLAIVFALIGIVIYISFRFEFAFAVGCIAALLHDVLITVGLYCLFGRQLSLPIVAALLTIVGYSVNDTIVVFDRIREDLKLLKGRPYKDVANISINQTLGRTLMTSITTLLTVTMLLVFGGGAINDFALALFIGVIVGTYSSVFIATPVMLLWHKGEKVKA